MAGLQLPHIHLPKLLGELRDRYLTREGGYTRVVRTEPKNTYDQGESAILELVDGPRDSRFMMTAKTVARDRMQNRRTTPVTAQNIKKITQFRGTEDFERMVRRFMQRGAQADEQNRLQEEDVKDEEVDAAAEALDREEGIAAKKMAKRIVPDSVRGKSNLPAW